VARGLARRRTSDEQARPAHRQGVPIDQGSQENCARFCEGGQEDPATNSGPTALKPAKTSSLGVRAKAAPTPELSRPGTPVRRTRKWLSVVCDASSCIGGCVLSTEGRAGLGNCIEQFRARPSGPASRSAKAIGNFPARRRPHGPVPSAAPNRSGTTVVPATRPHPTRRGSPHISSYPTEAARHQTTNTSRPAGCSSPITDRTNLVRREH
jgi:hypothetical protein